MDLFRHEAKSAESGDDFGRVVMIRPLSTTVISAVAIVIAAILAIAMLTMTYTRRTQVVGILVPDRGLMKVVSQQPGVVQERRVREGQAVKAGDVLYVVSAERVTTTAGQAGIVIDSNQVVLDAVKSRQQSLTTQANLQSLLARQQGEQISRQIGDIKTEMSQLDVAIDIQQSRTVSAESQYATYKGLADRDYISVVASQQKMDDYMDQRSRLQGLKRERQTLVRQLFTLNGDHRQIRTRSESEMTELDRMMSELKQTEATTGVQSKFLIRAPQDGIVTAILAQPGQMVSNQTLLTILPEGAVFKAQLYAASHAAGFINAGQKVRIRYSGFPYQKFGQYGGTVSSVSRAALTSDELPAQLAGALQKSGAGGYYRIDVDLHKQEVRAYGKSQPLRAGMQVDANIMQERRTLIEWVFEPLYSISG